MTIKDVRFAAAKEYQTILSNGERKKGSGEGSLARGRALKFQARHSIALLWQTDKAGK